MVPVLFRQSARRRDQARPTPTPAGGGEGGGPRPSRFRRAVRWVGRAILGAIAAGLAAGLAVAVAALLLMVGVSLSEGRFEAATTAMAPLVFGFYGLMLGLAGTVAVGLPLHLLASLAGWTGRATYAVAGALGGLVAVFLLFDLAPPEGNQFAIYGLGAWAGLWAGLAGWRVAVGRAPVTTG